MEQYTHQEQNAYSSQMHTNHTDTHKMGSQWLGVIICKAISNKELARNASNEFLQLTNKKAKFNFKIWQKIWFKQTSSTVILEWQIGPEKKVSIISHIEMPRYPACIHTAKIKKADQTKC